MKMLEYVMLRMLIEANWKLSLGQFPDYEAYQEIHSEAARLQEELGLKGSLFEQEPQEEIDESYFEWRDRRDSLLFV